ncbi:PDDEXK nuclease domain-containing protein [Dyadobacter sp. 22481]|uniref:PDDEXK nuclease domain-containing protein n=1 Tax=Dyadobacter sp. 22481 TaxID=3453926 RepID=UPI003F839482
MADFNALVTTIQETNFTLQQSASKAINRYLTIRNWLIGFHIVEFEQNGEDRARYGQRLIEELATALDTAGLSVRSLKLFRQFYFTYPQIGQTVSAQFKSMPSIRLNNLPARLDKVNDFVDDQSQKISIDAETLLSRLSFSHLVLLLPLKEPEKRAFYEKQCIKSNWSVAELKRQINTLYYERSGMSLDPEALGRSVDENAQRPGIADIIKSPFTFEFLGLKAKDVVYESDLEQALVDNLEAFLIELGHGFCFEAKQKRMVIGDEYFFVDLVFYHRILKYHVLIELKTNEVKHEHIGQLKTYINYYKKEIMNRDDNPPVGLLLVTDQNRALVEYAVADSDMQLFVSKYVVSLPSKEQLQTFIQNELAQMRS